MSAIDFRTSVTRKADPKGDRVVITLDGKVSAQVYQVWLKLKNAVLELLHCRGLGSLNLEQKRLYIWAFVCMVVII